MENSSNYNDTLNFEIEKRQVFVADQFGNPILNEKKVALVNNETEKILSFMSPSYRLFTNEEFIRLTERIGSAFDLKLNHYASHKDGAKVLSVFNQTDKQYKLLDYTFENNIVLYDSRDGSTKLCVGGSGVLYRCQNMFKSTDVQFSVNHSRKLDDMLFEFESALSKFGQSQENYLQRLEKLADIKVTKDDFNKLIANWVMLTPKEVNEVANGMHTDLVSTRKANIINGLTESWNIETNDLGKNGFGMHNAVTHYYTHNRQKSITDLFFGDFAKKEKQTIQFAESL